MEHTDAAEFELQYMIAIDTGDTDRAAAIAAEWDARIMRQARQDERIGWLIVGTSATLWLGVIVIFTHLVTQLIP